MPSVEIVTIGTEILLGEITDTNAGHIARALAARGIDVYRKTSVGDNVARIAAVVREAAARADLVITTGGLGPTVDDPTRDALAAAAGVPTEFRPELWEAIQAIFRRYGSTPTENNRRQAYIPRGARAIDNPVGTAPAFRVEVGGRPVIALPGVPREMEHLLEHAVLPWLADRYRLESVIVIRVLHTAGLGESLVDAQIHDLEQLANPTVGLAAHAGRVDVRITAKAASRAHADALVAPIEAELRHRLGDRVYGADAETLADALLSRIAGRGWRLAVVEAGLNGRLVSLVAAAGAAPGTFVHGELRPMLVDPGNAHAQSADPGNAHTQSTDPAKVADQLTAWVVEESQATGAEVVLGIALVPGAERRIAHFALRTPEGEQRDTRSHGGHPRLAAERAANLGLDWVRQVVGGEIR